MGRRGERRRWPYRTTPGAFRTGAFVIATLIILAAVAGVLYYVLRGPGARA
jgi:hypothetical protein